MPIGPVNLMRIAEFQKQVVRIVVSALAPNRSFIVIPNRRTDQGDQEKQGRELPETRAATARSESLADRSQERIVRGGLRFAGILLD